MRNLIQLPSHEQCTACGVCQQVCPAGSIRFKKDELSCRYPVIDPSSCLRCGSCMKHCHLLNQTEKNAPQRVYVAWNTANEDRQTSASGGIASAMYRYALQHGISTYGVHYEVHHRAEYMPVHTSEDITICKNSKYVSSECIGVFPDIKKRLVNGERVIFIGLPCHVSALKSYLGKSYEGLLLVDIICHGVAPVDYLNQHIQTVEKKKKKYTDCVFFRDPQYGTENFLMTLVDNGNRFYCAAPRGGDAYSTGYHLAMIYRENCYHCQYAEPNRISDVTIGDFSGLGRFRKWEGSKVGVSCMLVSTEKGQQFIEQLMEEAFISCKERPLEEALEFEKQLIHPSVPHKNREAFKLAYTASQNFDEAAKKLLKDDVILFRKQQMKKRLRDVLSHLVPGQIKTMCRRFFGKE